MPITKPSLWHEPAAWLRRKLQLKLNDALGRLYMRVVDRVGFGALRTSFEFAHIIDVGVADGTNDLYQRFPDATIDLFEPSPLHHEKIETTILSKIRGSLHKVALGREDTQSELYLTGRTGSTLLQDHVARPKTTKHVSVPVRRLDSVLKPKNIKKPCLLKIDTEGYELDVLEGARGLLSHIDCVVVEVHFRKANAYSPANIVNLLAEYDFHLTDMLDHHIRRHHVVCADLVFIRRRSEA